MPLRACSLVVLLFVVLGLLVVTPSPAQMSPPPKGRKVIILIGVQKYADKTWDGTLHCPEADVDALAERCQMLVQQGYELYKFTTALPSSNKFFPTFRNVQGFLTTLGRLDTLLFYHSGHGKSVDELLYLALHDTNRVSVVENALCLPFLLLQFKVRAEQAAFIVDACRSYGKGKDGTGKDGTGDTRSGTLGMKDVAVDGKPLLASYAVLYAAKNGHSAYEGKTHSLMTAGLLKTFDQLPRGRPLTLNYLADGTIAYTPELARAQGYAQHPHFEAVGNGTLVLSEGRPGDAQVRAVDTSGRLLVQSNTPGAEIRVDGRLVGRIAEVGAAEVSVDLGADQDREVEVTLTHPQRRIGVFKARVRRGQAAAGQFDLQPLDLPESRETTLERLPATAASTLTRGATVELALLRMPLRFRPPGTFRVGSEANDSEAYSHEKPAATIRLPQGQLLGQFEVTVGQWKQYCIATGAPMRPAPSWVQQDNFPIVNITYSEVLKFCGWVNRELKRTGSGWWVRPPTEWEWEAAARGPAAADGQSRRYPWGNTPPDSTQAVVAATGPGGKRDRPAPVGGRSPGASEMGCEDLCGNVWEWTCSGWTDPVPRMQQLVQLPRTLDELAGGGLRTLRGGSYYSSSRDSRAACRGNGEGWYGLIGFRVAAVPALD